MIRKIFEEIKLSGELWSGGVNKRGEGGRGGRSTQHNKEINMSWDREVQSIVGQQPEPGVDVGGEEREREGRGERIIATAVLPAPLSVLMLICSCWWKLPQTPVICWLSSQEQHPPIGQSNQTYQSIMAYFTSSSGTFLSPPAGGEQGQAQPAGLISSLSPH